MVRLREERDIETIRQVGILLDNENKRLIERNRKLTLELARALGLDEKRREQMELSLLQELDKTRETIFRQVAGSGGGPTGLARWLAMRMSITTAPIATARTWRNCAISSDGK